MFAFDLNKIPFSKGFLLFVIFFALVIPPFFFLFEFEKQIFEKYILVEVLLFSLAIGCPVLGLNYAVELAKHRLSQTLPEKKDKEDWSLKVCFEAAIDTIFVFYLPCIMTFWDNYSHKQAVNFAVAFQLGLGTSIILSGIKKKKRDASKSNPEDSGPAKPEDPQHSPSSSSSDPDA